MHNAFKGVGNDVKELAYYTIAFMQTTEQKLKSLNMKNLSFKKVLSKLKFKSCFTLIRDIV